VSFTAIPTALFESEIWKSLGLNETRLIIAIVIAHARAGGCKNGYLVLTHQQMKGRGIRGDRIKPTIKKLVGLGLLEVTHRGGPADPARYRVTFLPHRIEEANSRVSYYPPGNEWIELELEIIDGRRVAREKRHTPPPRITDAQRRISAPLPGSKCDPIKKTETTALGSAQPVDESSKSVTATPSRFLRRADAGR
jgi:hypothetical protein